MMEQLTLFDVLDSEKTETDKEKYIVDCFSAGGFCVEAARQALEEKYEPILEITNKFDRKSVSYQLSKKDLLHSWLRYKEGFSAELVNTLLDDMDVTPGDVIMDPFMGSGTTALVCQMRGIDSIGYDILPISKVSVLAKANVMRYEIKEIKNLIDVFDALKMPENYSGKTPYVVITDTAYPEFNEKFLQYATEWILKSHFSNEIKNLFTLCVMNSLERCSYTSKSGQYLRWDSRSRKVINANIVREKAGRKRLTVHHCREKIENIQEVIKNELHHVLYDIQIIQREGDFDSEAAIDFRQNSVLYELPKLEAELLKGVITSPPYCNRYDYTRTYALELVYLGLGENALKEMRQSLLSCTVENRSKVDRLKEYYAQIGASDRFEAIYHTIYSNLAFQEILQALTRRKANGDLNNNGVIRMVEGYFTELAFVYAELYRVCKKGATVAFVNDNVRYGGEIIPVDYLSTSLAEQFGFTPVKVYCLKQQKGNSSQQMKKFGKSALRKSITIWKKEG